MNCFATLILIATFGFSKSATAAPILCQLKDATQIVETKRLSIPQGEKALFAVYQGFRFEVRNKAQQQFEIEVFDPNIPARSYAESRLSVKEDFLKWSLWTRYASLDFTCQLAAPSSPRR